MPRRLGQPREHRDKTPSLGFVSYLALVARLVEKAEIASTPAAAQAMDKEWDCLRRKSACDENRARVWADVWRLA